ncbi:acyl dehydratase [Actinomadura sp. KC345]|uniref:acyl dehydratase n=1 Tax=Actinomadura sp. KC345 TaxID=2530371 RepID=UPI001A9E9BB6|nr:acyl dehydratase [Actinomadura sp. KC345]
MPEPNVPGSGQRRFEDVAVGDRLPGLTLPLPVHRLVMAAGAGREFTATHHNDAYARANGAPSMYASAILLQGMWERALRDYIGLEGTIQAIRNFRMARFTPAGALVRVEGGVVAKERRAGRAVVEIELRTTADGVLTVGPGLAEVTLPERP